jgi:hypothetical protein
LNWFEIKLVGAAMGIVAINAIRFAWHLLYNHALVTALLIGNMLEAVFSDVQSGQGHWFDAMAGLLLILAILVPFQSTENTCCYKIECAK